MKKTRKIIKKMLVTLLAVLGLVLVVGLLFVNLSPQFGGKATKEQLAFYSKSENHQNGKFINLGGIKAEMSSGDMLKAIGSMFKTIPSAKPKNIEVQQIDSTKLSEYKAETRFIWFGHSAFLVQINGKNLLIDPMFGDVPAPHPLLGGKRFSKTLPIEIEQLPKIDAVLISHDHYDHLDYGSIKRLKHKVGTFFTPLGVGAHLRKWGIPDDKVVELDWWEETVFDDLNFTSTPAQHFSGRGLTDRDKTQWCSWVIQSETEKIFFSGDSGYAPHFKEIGNKYGPFDFAMMECGQYNELWHEVHMFPEETAQAGLDVKAKRIMPIHWGAFKLAPHSWTDPVQRVIDKAEALNVTLVIPEIGKPTGIHDTLPQEDKWWDNF